MASSKRGIETVKWDALELEAFNLKFERMSPEAKMRKAHRLAVLFRRYRQPVPGCLADLIKSENRRDGSRTAPASFIRPLI